jgi:hypothetical protein
MVQHGHQTKGVQGQIFRGVLVAFTQADDLTLPFKAFFLDGHP